jgi:hypothetical protein
MYFIVNVAVLHDVYRAILHQEHLSPFVEEEFPSDVDEAFHDNVVEVDSMLAALVHFESPDAL